MHKGNPFTVLIVDDHPIVRVGMRASLGEFPDIEVVGEAKTGGEVIPLVTRLRPNLVFLDLYLPDQHGLEILKTLTAEFPETRVIILSSLEDPLVIRSVLQAGAAGYLFKDSQPDELHHAISKVCGGERYFTPKVALLLVGQEDTPVSEDALTDRENQVLDLVAEGLSSKEIAEKLSISPRTVEKHRERIKEKLGVHTTAELTRFAIRKSTRTPPPKR